MEAAYSRDRLRTGKCARDAAFCLGAILCLLGAASNASAAVELQLISNGQAVATRQLSAVYNEAIFPGFACKAGDGSELFQGGPSATLRFKLGGEGGDYAFDSCMTSRGEEVAISASQEDLIPKLREVKITASEVSERFSPVPFFEDTETGCVYKLTKLSGALPASHSLTEVALGGTARRDTRLSAHTCAKTAAVSDTSTIEAAPEGAPPGSYEVEELA
jgi:hypothetical protein